MSTRLLITGCGRSGTKKMHTLCETMGIVSAHEPGADDVSDGVVSWLAPHTHFAVYEGPVWQVVRHPVMMAKSFKRLGFFERNNGEKHHRAILEVLGYNIFERKYPELDYWIDWNKAVEKRADKLIRIEDTNIDTAHAIAEVVGYGTVEQAAEVAVSISINTVRAYEYVELDLSGYDRLQELTELADHYGYEVD